MAGRKPLPTNTKKLRGNPGKRKLNTQEPVFEVAIPEPPPNLDAAALEEWNRIALDMANSQTISRVDRAILAIYCQVWSEWQNSTGKTAIEMRYLRKEMQSYAAELGITPSSRSRVKMIGKPAKEPDKRQALAEKLFKAPVSKHGS